jgi:hypothetical protein
MFIILQLRDEVAKPEAHKKTALSEVAILSFPPFSLTFLSMLRIYLLFFFAMFNWNVSASVNLHKGGEVAALPSYEEKEEQFKEQVTWAHPYDKNSSVSNLRTCMFLIDIGFKGLYFF